MTPGSASSPFDYLRRNAEASPNGVFSRSPHETVTNGEALASATKLAYEFRRLGVRPGQTVALDLPDQLGLIFTEATWHEAAVSTVVPPGHTAPSGFGIDWLFTVRPGTTQPGARTVEVDRAFLGRVEENPWGIRPRTEPLDVFRVVFSSGTTGRPKAVALGRSMEVALDAVMPMWMDSGPTLMLMDTGTAWGVGEFFLSVKASRPFLSGAGAPSAPLVDLAERAGVRSLNGSPAQLVALVDELERRERVLSAVETVVVAGTVTTTSLTDRLRRVTDGCRVISSYGSTEAGSGAVRPYDSDDPFDAGFPAPGTSLEVVDEQDRLVPAGAEGVIRYRTPGMAREYLGDPESTARAFRHGWFYPGDRGFIRADGGLTLVGRETELLNAGGVKVDPGRVDLAALENPAVSDACAFGYPSAAGVDRVGVAVVAGPRIDLDALGADLAVSLGGAAPDLVVRIDEIPRTATGKPLRRELGDRFAGH